MIISHKYKFIFIKTRKTAGTSIEIYLSQYCDKNDTLTPIIPHVEPHVARNHEGCKNHMSALDVKNKVGNQIWNEYFVFCVERNPWDKTVSYYHMQNTVQKTKLDFDGYLSTKDLCSDYELYTDSDGSVIVDRIIKYENLNNELSSVFNKLKIPFHGALDIYAKNEYRNKNKKYQEYFTSDQVDLIKQSHHKEIELLGYSFNDKKMKPAIYIHSLFRSGSTYLFDKFRKLDKDFYCYQEPLNESLLDIKHNPDEVLKAHKDVSINLRHPSLDKPYFFEFHLIAGKISKYLDESLCYKKFFDSEDKKRILSSYVECLKTHTEKTAVLQMCRSFGRVDAFSDGCNIFLWRNPWDQWWSYRVDNYFNVRNLLILNADNLPLFLRDIRKKVGIEKFNSSSLDEEIDHFNRVYLSSSDNYFVFYALWCYSLIENYLKIDLLINIDALSESEDYRSYISDKLKSMGIVNINFSDCRSPIRSFDEQDVRFFNLVEKDVHELMFKAYPEKRVSAMLTLKDEFTPSRIKKESKESLLKEISNLRRVVTKQDDYFYNIIELITNVSKKSHLEEINDIKLAASEKLQELHKDNERINQQYLSIIDSNSWKALQHLHPLLDVFKCIFSKKGIDYADLDPSNEKEQELIIDTTHIHKKDLKTGIQRVVRSVLKEFENEHNKKYAVQTVFLSSKGVYKYCDNKQIVVPKKGDVFLGLDLNARISKLDSMFSLWLDRGVKINFVVYDIIPILYPHWWNSRVSIAHEQWLRAVLKYSSNVACISEVVANDVKEYCAKSPLLKDEVAKVQSFHLGADIENSQPSEGIPKDADICRKRISERATFLMVGTIEPRKGYQEVLDAFNMLWSKGKKINLIIVGKKGWMMDDFLSQISAHRGLNENLFYFDNASDEFLKELYENSACLLAASEAEGFGLPLIEAAKYHLPVIARDIPVFKEITDSHASFFETGLLAEAILQWLDLYETNKHPKNDNMPIYTWKESAQELTTIVGL